MALMRRLDEALERREQLRVSQRLGCALLVGGRRYEGVLADLSADAVLVQMDAELPCGTDVVVSLGVPKGEIVVIEATVRERRAVARSLASATAGATLLRVEDPPAAWLRFVEAEIGKAL